MIIQKNTSAAPATEKEGECAGSHHLLNKYVYIYIYIYIYIYEEGRGATGTEDSLLMCEYHSRSLSIHKHLVLFWVFHSVIHLDFFM